MHISKKLLTVGLFSGIFIVSTQAQAEVKANIGVVSNYLWRSLTQTNDGAAVQGGVDYTHSSGWYVGTWMSNVDFGTAEGDNRSEVDIYTGYGNKVGKDWSYDAGLNYFTYPLAENSNFGEIYGSATWKLISFGLAYTITSELDEPSPFRSGDIYSWIGVDYDLPQKWSVGGIIGNYNFKDLSSSSSDATQPVDGFGDYAHIQLYFGRSTNWGDFTIAVDKNDLKGENPDGKKRNAPRYWLGFKKEF